MTTSRRLTEPQKQAARSAAPARPANRRKLDWTQAVATKGEGVQATIEVVKRTRGPGRNPSKTQVAIRLDRDVIEAFKADGQGWQTRMNAALRQWLAEHARLP